MIVLKLKIFLLHAILGAVIEAFDMFSKFAAHQQL